MTKVVVPISRLDDELWISVPSAGAIHALADAFTRSEPAAPLSC
jgi:hypothetical protein